MTIALWLARDLLGDGDAGGRRHEPVASENSGETTSAAASDEDNAFAVSDSAALSRSDPRVQARDVTLVIRIHAGEVEALVELMQHYAVQLAAVAATVLGSSDLTHDIIHDVFLTLWDHREAIDAERNIVGYLHRAVRNRSLNVLEQERSQQRIAQNAAIRDCDLPQTVRNDAEHVLEYEDLNAQLRVALAHVSPRLREVFWLRWSAGLSNEEIATLLGISTKSVKQQMYRATQQLATIIPRNLL